MKDNILRAGDVPPPDSGIRHYEGRRKPSLIQKLTSRVQGGVDSLLHGEEGEPEEYLDEQHLKVTHVESKGGLVGFFTGEIVETTLIESSPALDERIKRHWSNVSHGIEVRFGLGSEEYLKAKGLPYDELVAYGEKLGIIRKF